MGRRAKGSTELGPGKSSLNFKGRTKWLKMGFAETAQLFPFPLQ